MAAAAINNSEILPVRKYRSRKQKPCDNCRRRRVCCVRDAEGDCALCSRRSIPCTFSSKPSPRKRHARPLTSSPAVGAQQNEPDGEEESHVTTRTTPPNAPPERQGGAEGKYVGLTGTDDVYFVADRFEGLGNDPAREAYFRVRFWFEVCDTASLIDVCAAIGTIILGTIGLVERFPLRHPLHRGECASNSIHLRWRVSPRISFARRRPGSERKAVAAAGGSHCNHHEIHVSGAARPAQQRADRGAHVVFTPKGTVSITRNR